MGKLQERLRNVKWKNAGENIFFLSGFSAVFDHTLCYSRKDFFTKLYFLNHFLQKAILNQKSIGNQIPLYPPVRRETSGTLVI